MKEYAIYKDGLSTTMTVTDIDGLVELKMKQYLIGPTGNALVDSEHKHYFTVKEFQDFFQPFVNDLKVRFDNEPRQSGN